MSRAPPGTEGETDTLPRTGLIFHQPKAAGGFVAAIEYMSESTVLSVVAVTVVTTVPLEAPSFTVAVKRLDVKLGGLLT